MRSDNKNRFLPVSPRLTLTEAQTSSCNHAAKAAAAAIDFPSALLPAVVVQFTSSAAGRGVAGMFLNLQLQCQ